MDPCPLGPRSTEKEKAFARGHTSEAASVSQPAPALCTCAGKNERCFSDPRSQVCAHLLLCVPENARVGAAVKGSCRYS